jgi:MFS family permease
VFLLATVLFINYIDRGTVATVAHSLQGDLKLDDAQMGKLFSAFFWVYAIVQIPVGWLAERYGAGRVLTIGLLIWATATILAGFAHSFSMLLGLRLMLGLGESAGFPCVSKLLALAVPAKGLGTANGIVGFAYTFGPAVGLFVGGQIMIHFGWRAPFVVFGVLSLLWLIPWSRTKVPTEATAVARAKEAEAGNLVPGAAEIPDDRWPTYWMIWKQRSLWGTGLGLFSSNYVFYFILNWMPEYLERVRGYSADKMTTVGFWAFVTMALSALAAGWAIDRYVRRGGSANFGYKSVMAVAHVGALICMLAMAAGSEMVSIVAMFVYQALCGASSPGVYAMSQILAGPRASGRWVGIQNCVGNLSGSVAPWLTGVMIKETGHFTSAFVVAGMVSLLGLIGWLWMVPTLKELHWEQPPGRALPEAA